MRGGVDSCTGELMEGCRAVAGLGGGAEGEGDSHGDDDVLGPNFSREEQQRAMYSLQQWLEMEAAMEDMIDGFEKDGWF
jgi:hypothetical protein